MFKFRKIPKIISPASETDALECAICKGNVLIYHSGPQIRPEIFFFDSFLKHFPGFNFPGINFKKIIIKIEIRCFQAANSHDVVRAFVLL